jgi:hypothetical protein
VVGSIDDYLVLLSATPFPEYYLKNTNSNPTESIFKFLHLVEQSWAENSFSHPGAHALNLILQRSLNHAFLRGQFRQGETDVEFASALFVNFVINHCHRIFYLVALPSLSNKDRSVLSEGVVLSALQLLSQLLSFADVSTKVAALLDDALLLDSVLSAVLKLLLTSMLFAP